jgi:hypothetical protein
VEGPTLAPPLLHTARPHRSLTPIAHTDRSHHDLTPLIHPSRPQVSTLSRSAFEEVAVHFNGPTLRVRKAMRRVLAQRALTRYLAQKAGGVGARSFVAQELASGFTFVQPREESLDVRLERCMKRAVTGEWQWGAKQSGARGGDDDGSDRVDGGGDGAGYAGDGSVGVGAELRALREQNKQLALQMQEMAATMKAVQANLAVSC